MVLNQQNGGVGGDYWFVVDGSFGLFRVEAGGRKFCVEHQVLWVPLLQQTIPAGARARALGSMLGCLARRLTCSSRTIRSAVCAVQRFAFALPGGKAGVFNRREARFQLLVLRHHQQVFNHRHFVLRAERTCWKVQIHHAHGILAQQPLNRAPHAYPPVGPPKAGRAVKARHFAAFRLSSTEFPAHAIPAIHC